MRYITPITQREIQILHLISNGLSSEAIARRLYVSISTIHTHRKNLLNKLEANNSAELVRRGFEFGILKESMKLKMVV